jgi:hypothetical protein
MPGSQGTAAVGGILDQFVTKGMTVLKTAFPVLGNALSFVGDIAKFVLEPMGNLMESMVFGAATYLELPQAEAVIKDMQDNWSSYAKDAFMDFLYAFYRRVGSTGKTVVDLKEGRDPILQGAMGGALDMMGIGRNSNRVANRIYTKAIAAGAKDWQAAAAVCYGLLKGLQIKGFPSGFKLNVKGVDVLTVTGSDTSKAMWVLGNDFDLLYFAKLGPKSSEWHSLAWVEKQYKSKSGGVMGGGADTVRTPPAAKTSGGGLFPLLAVAGAAILAMRGK